jgi:hypothetical protein
MKRRVFAAFLWFYACCYGGAILADYLGVSPMLFPMIGVVAAALMVFDPRKIIWSDLGLQRSRAKERLAASSTQN